MRRGLLFEKIVVSLGESVVEERMAMASEPHLPLEIGHVLFIDIVGYSKLLINEQSEVLQELNEVVRETERVRLADRAGKLIRLPAGDGMALVFRDSPEGPAECALQISRELRSHPNVRVRMGIHSGPVNEVVDVNERSNIAGAGINLAQRVMDCGDAGHILLSKRVADDLAQYRHWQPFLHDLGVCEVKHGHKIEVFNLFTEEAGNSALPEKFAGKGSDKTSGDKSRRSAILVSIAALILLALGAGSYVALRRGPSPVSAPTSMPNDKRIAVLPFKPLLPGSGDEVLEFGMADSLITKLSNSHELIISSLPSVRKYSGLEQDPVAAGRALQVDSVLEGSLQKMGDHIRVNARFIRVRDGASLWAATFDEKFTDVFAVQDAISEKVAEALALRLSGAEKRQLNKRSTENLEAYQLYLTGRYHWNLLSPPEIKKSIGYFEQAIALDPTYAMAYFGLADAYRTLSINGDSRPNDALSKAKAAASKAIELDQTLAEPHVTLAFIHVWFDWDWTGAEAEAKRAIELSPNLSFAYAAHSQLLTALGHHPEAVSEATRARQLDPVSPIINTLEGLAFFYADRYDESAASLQRALELNPNLWIAHLIRGKVHLQKEDYPGAIAEFTLAGQLSGNASEPISMIAFTATQTGDSAKALALQKELLATSQQRYISPFNIAVTYLGLGQREQCFDWLDKALQDHDVRLCFLRVDKRWDSLRSEPRFAAIAQRLDLQ
ncbi:MAG: tetratricopeptide repeat protein [Chthoniobacterales bacterium]|nr:tetratricopeptide repeat protein [Chthoniobacterales bacterium]